MIELSEWRVGEFEGEHCLVNEPGYGFKAYLIESKRGSDAWRWEVRGYPEASYSSEPGVWMIFEICEKQLRQAIPAMMSIDGIYEAYLADKAEEAADFDQECG